MFRSHPLTLAIGVALSLPALAQSDTEAEARSLDEVVVVGSRRAERTVAESMAPVDVLRPVEITNAGTPELQAVLTRMVPSFNFPRTSITDASDHVRPAQLRGLAPDQTLVLINGKRRHRTAIINVNGTLGRGSSPVDLNALPIGAIQRVEVLRDGAAAQYGSDAIAGVINIVLKSQSDGGTVSGHVGRYDEGDGLLKHVWSNLGMAIGDGGFLNLTADWRDKGFTNRSGPDLRQQYPLVGGRPDPREASFNRINHRFGDAETEDQLLAFNGSLPLDDAGTDTYTFGSFSKRFGTSAGFYRRALDARNIPAIYPNGFLPLINSDVIDFAWVIGLRGVFGNGWGYDLSFNTGSSSFDFLITNSLNVTLGPTSPTEFHAGRLKADSWSINADFTNAFEVANLAGPLNVAAGFEYRKEGFTIHPGVQESFLGSGSQVFPGFRPGDSGRNTRDNYAVYLDLEADVSERVTMGLAARYEDYSDFGSELAGKASIRVAFTESVAARASVSNGFRAPNLQQQFYSTTATNFINVGGGLQPFDVRTFPVTNPVAVALGAEPLKAETSNNFSVGLVFTPGNNFNLTVDYYRIDIDDRIILSENLTGAAVRAFLAARGFPNTDGGRYFTNAVDTRTRGFDVVGRYLWQMNNGSEWQFTVGYNRNDTDIERIAPNPAVLQSGGLNLQRVGRVEIGRLTVGPPKDKTNVGIDWRYHDFEVQLNSTRYGRWGLLNVNPLLDESFKAQWVTDLAISYNWRDAWRFTIGAENLSDAYPPLLNRDISFDANGFAVGGPRDNSFVGILPYARGEAPFGFNGRFYYGRATFNW